jgi:predicted nuclease with TOPRIM domain
VTVEAVFTVEEKRKLQKLTEEVPKLRSRVEELEETLEILSNKELMQSIEVSEKEIAENRLFSRSEALKELGINEEEDL